MPRPIRLIVSLLLLWPPMAFRTAAQSRAPSAVRGRANMVRLNGNRHPSARAQFDIGAADPSLPIGPVTVFFKKTAEQEQALSRLLADQQDPFSPQYQHWLSPEEYAERFGAQPEEIAKVTAWLESEGFAIGELSRGRNWITFSGTASQVEAALHTATRKYRVRGELHFANSAEPAVPEEIASVVEAFTGLDDFRPKAANTGWRLAGAADSPVPQATYGSNHYLAPADFATIYDLAPLYSMGIDGAGQKIVVAGQTELDLADVRSFRSRYNLPASDPELVLPPGDKTPGVTDDLIEANLDVQWAGALAPKAAIVYVYSSDVLRSVQYAVSQNLAPVISFSYVLCESTASQATLASLRSIARQANAQGITWVAASGDSGAAGCDLQNRDPVAKGGMAVSLPASLPEVTGVGGTQFSSGNGSYWAANNSVSGGSAMAYIPEAAWNESSQSNGLLATGGGLSAVFGRPGWQTGPGVPANARGVPDVSFPASSHDGYLIVTSGRLAVSGGTSAGTPAFSALVALLNQYGLANRTQASPGQGNLNPALYRAAQSVPGSFHDVTSGNNIVPCSSGSACSDGWFGYHAGPGYDVVTGLGSPDAFTFVTGSSSRAAVNTSTSVAADPATLSPDGSTILNATVSAASSAALPAGTVTFYAGNVSLGSAALATSGGKATAAINVRGAQLSRGSNVITAQYGGDPGFNSSTATTVVTVSVAAASVVVSIGPNPVFQRRADAEGFSWFYTITLTEAGGAAATLSDFSINGTSNADQITRLFGSAVIPAGGKLSAAMSAKDLSVPTTVKFHFSGSDASGRQWSQDVSVPFFGFPKEYSGEPVCMVYGSGENVRGCPSDQPLAE